jgi:hypothetical protein
MVLAFVLVGAIAGAPFGMAAPAAVCGGFGALALRFWQSIAEDDASAARVAARQPPAPQEEVEAERRAEGGCVLALFGLIMLGAAFVLSALGMAG